MKERALSFQDCWPIIEREVQFRRGRGFPNLAFDDDDLLQEASITALACVEGFDPSKGAKVPYVQRAIRNHFAKLVGRACAAKRAPTDAWGHLLAVTSLDGLVEIGAEPSERAVSEEVVAARELIEVLRTRLPRNDFEWLVASFSDGARDLLKVRHRREQSYIRLLRAHVRVILTSMVAYPVRSDNAEVRGMPRIELPETPEDELPECHARGTSPQGYNTEDVVCHQCPDKFTCLPEALEKKLLAGQVSMDREVESVLAGKLAYDAAIARMRKRQAILAAGEKVPAALSPGPVPRAVRAAVERSEVVVEEATPMQLPADVVKEVEKPVVKVVKAKAPVVKARAPVVKAKAPATQEVMEEVEKPSTVEKPVEAPQNEIVQLRADVDRLRAEVAVIAAARVKAKVVKVKAKAGKKKLRAPKPRVITEEKMQKMLGQVKIGQLFELDYGHQLVRKHHGKRDDVVTLTKYGFEYRGKSYSSLSACSRAANPGQSISGNFYFNIQANKNTEIRDAKGNVIASKLMLSEKSF